MCVRRRSASCRASTADLVAANDGVLDGDPAATVDQDPDASHRVGIGAVGRAGEHRAIEVDRDVLAADDERRRLRSARRGKAIHAGLDRRSTGRSPSRPSAADAAQASARSTRARSARRHGAPERALVAHTPNASGVPVEPKLARRRHVAEERRGGDDRRAREDSLRRRGPCGSASCD